MNCKPITNEEFLQYYNDLLDIAWEFEGVGTNHYQESLYRNREKIAEIRTFTDNLAAEIYYLTGVGYHAGEIHPSLIA